MLVKKRTVDAERVLQTAITLADASSVDSLTLASVANALGIRLPSLYNHVAGLPGLRYQLALWATREFGDQLRRAAVGKAGEDAIVSIGLAARAFAHTHPGLYILTQRPAQADQPELAAAQADVIDIFLVVLAPYGENENDRLHLIRALRSLLHGFVDLETSGGFGMPLDIEESFRRALDLFIRGLHAP